MQAKSFHSIYNYTRAVLSNAGNNIAQLHQETHYYPFGLEIPELSKNYSPHPDENRYRYNGKEKLVMKEDNDLFWLDYGARMYDASLGRWHTPDPLSEWSFKLSPYNYVGNDPIRFIDPDGRFRTWIGAAWHSLTNGGGKVGKDKNTGQYFVSGKEKVSKDSEGGFAVSVSREFGKHGNSPKQDLGRKSGSQPSGYNFTLKHGLGSAGVKGESGVESIPIDVLLPALSMYGPLNNSFTPLSAANAAQKAGQIIQTAQEPPTETPDSKINDKNITDGSGNSESSPKRNPGYKTKKIGSRIQVYINQDDGDAIYPDTLITYSEGDDSATLWLKGRPHAGTRDSYQNTGEKVKIPN